MAIMKSCLEPKTFFTKIKNRFILHTSTYLVASIMNILKVQITIIKLATTKNVKPVLFQYRGPGKKEIIYACLEKEICMYVF